MIWPYLLPLATLLAGDTLGIAAIGGRFDAEVRVARLSLYR